MVFKMSSDALKIARATPIYTSGPKEGLSNYYRPISVLPSLSVVFDKLIYRRLMCEPTLHYDLRQELSHTNLSYTHSNLAQLFCAESFLNYSPLLTGIESQIVVHKT